MTSAVFLDYKGMTVEQVTKLRAEFRKAGVEYRVVKNTLVKQALKDDGVRRKLNDVLVGHDRHRVELRRPLGGRQGRQGVQEGRGEAGEKLQVKAGLIEGAVLDATRVENQLATMPGKDELRAQLLATLQAPLQQFVALLQAPAQNFVYVLSAKEREARRTAEQLTRHTDQRGGEASVQDQKFDTITEKRHG